MRRRDPVRIGEVMTDFFTSSPTIARKIAEARIEDLWPQLVGDLIASYTTRIEIKTGRMTVYLASSVVRNEVFMRREALRTAINQASGMEIVKVLIVK